jgi:hypothetical protein
MPPPGDKPWKEKPRGPSENELEQRELTVMLRSSTAAQKAILLREILGRPLALRRGAACGGWDLL